MGPIGMFTRRMVQDELDLHKELFPWGLIHLFGPPDLAAADFLAELGLEGCMPFYIGCMHKLQLPHDLSQPRNWTVEEFLKFQENIQASFLSPEKTQTNICILLGGPFLSPKSHVMCPFPGSDYAEGKVFHLGKGIPVLARRFEPRLCRVGSCMF